MSLTHDDGRRTAEPGAPHTDAFGIPAPLPRQRGPEPDPEGTPASGDRRRGPDPRRGRHRLRFRRLVLVVVSAFALVPATAATLGLVGVTPSQFGLGADAGPGAETVAGGADGLYPGGPAATADVHLASSAAVAVTPSSLTPDPGSLPAGCPASAWRIEAPGPLPAVPAGGRVAVPVTVGLTPAAPDACQGRTVRLDLVADLPGGGSLRSALTVRTATLGSPTATVAVRGGAVALVLLPAAGGPRATAFDVAVLPAADDDAGAAAPLCHGVAGECVDRAAPPAGERRYVVTARLGGAWLRSGPVLHAWTPPPGPALSFAGAGTSRVRVQSRGGSADYEVSLLADGVPMLTWQVPAGQALARTVPLPALGAGRHHLVAVARFRGWRAPSASLRITLSGDGSTTETVVEAPDPVSADPITPPVVTTDAPTATTTGAPEPPVVTRTLAPVVRSQPRRYNAPQPQAPVVEAPATESTDPAPDPAQPAETLPDDTPATTETVQPDPVTT